MGHYPLFALLAIRLHFLRIFFVLQSNKFVKLAFILATFILTFGILDFRIGQNQAFIIYISSS